MKQLLVLLAIVVVGVLLVRSYPGARGGSEEQSSDVRAADPTAVSGQGDTLQPATRGDTSPPMFVLAIEGEGLRAFDAATGSARPIPFGSEMGTTMTALERILRSRPEEEGENVDCGTDYARWVDGLTVWFVRDRFVGWSLRDRTSLTTASGIGIGSTRSELEQVYVAEILNSTLGVEFVASGIAGLLESSDADARITHLWAGQTCIAR